MEKFIKVEITMTAFDRVVRHLNRTYSDKWSCVGLAATNRHFYLAAKYEHIPPIATSTMTKYFSVLTKCGYVERIGRGVYRVVEEIPTNEKYSTFLELSKMK